GDGAGARVSDSAIILADKLRNAGIAVAVFAPDGDGADLMHAAGIDDLFGVAVGGVSGDPPGGSRTVALAAAERVNAAPERTVIIGRAGTSRHYGGFAFVAGVDDFAEAVVRDRYRTVSALSNALASYGLLIGIVANRQPVVFCRFDGALADRDTATLVDGAAAALRQLASLCPVAVISGREVSELRARVGVDGLWYAGGHGREVVAPDGSHHHFDGTDWDPGAALTSIRARMGRPEPVLPIYVGSELADEAAFDVLRRTGCRSWFTTSGPQTGPPGRSSASTGPRRCANSSGAAAIGLPTSGKPRTRRGRSATGVTTPGRRSCGRRCAPWETDISPPGERPPKPGRGRCITRAPTPPVCSTASTTWSTAG